MILGGVPLGFWQDAPTKHGRVRDEGPTRGGAEVCGRSKSGDGIRYSLSRRKRVRVRIPRRICALKPTTGHDQRWLASRCEAMRSQRERIHLGLYGEGEREIDSGQLGSSSIGRIDGAPFPLIPAFSQRRRCAKPRAWTAWISRDHPTPFASASSKKLRCAQLGGASPFIATAGRKLFTWLRSRGHSPGVVSASSSRTQRTQEAVRRSLRKSDRRPGSRRKDHLR